MSYAGTVRRIVKESDNSFWLLIPVYYSGSEHRYHRVLPDYLVKFKHYTIQTITEAANDDQDLDQYDLPSDSSRKRWKDLAYALLNWKSDLKLSDDSSSLPGALHTTPNSGFADHVKVGFTFHRFSTAELGGLLNLSIYKRL